VRFAAGLLLVAAGLTVLFAATSGGFGALLQFYSQRTIGSDSATLRNSSFYIYLGPYLTIPAAILLLHAWMRRKTLFTGLMLAAATLAALALTVPRGDRTFILTLVLPLIALPYLRRERRPKLLVIVLTIVVTFMAANVLRSERFGESRQDPLNSAYTALTSPGKQLKDFISGPDPSLFTVLSLEYEAVPHDIGFSPGITPVSILAGPVPGKLWKDKPQPGLVHVTNYLFFQQALVARASFLPSAFGDMYADWGFVTVALYSLIVGVALRAIWDYFKRHEHNAGVQAVFASCLPLVIVFLRNNLGDTLGHSVALVLPIVVCTWVCSRPRGALLPRLRPRRGRPRGVRAGV
jgi:oligosaccharide repeat unit polymerase